MSARIVTYRQDRPADWLRDNPQEAWRCDIYTAGGTSHHGIGATEAEALIEAAMHYMAITRSAWPRPNPARIKKPAQT